jgi:heat-inducible transcriptional repressor
MRTAAEVCEQRGLKLTPLRLRVLELVWERHAPIGAYDILDKLSQEGLGSAPPTVYRALNFLIDAGLVHRIDTLNAYFGCEAPRSLAGISDVQEFMERTSRVLSLISRNVGVAVAMTSGPNNALEHVYFSRLGDQKVLAVVVTRSGVVRDRVLRLDLSQNDLDLAARYINENFRGWTMESLRTELARRIELERSEADRLMHSVEQLYKQGALAAERGAQVVFVEGAANLVTDEQDRKRLQEMLKTLEEKEKVVQLLGAYLDVKQEAVRVVIGLDQALPSMQNFVLIGAPARAGKDVMGSLAVIGPTRMDYQHTITAVSYIARLFDKILNEPE